MSKAVIIKKVGGPEVLEMTDVKLGSLGPDEVKVTNHELPVTTRNPCTAQRLCSRAHS